MDNEKRSQEEMVECEVCLKEVPLSAAKNEEAQDYVAHFCGIDCFAKWKARGETEEKL
jgi:hypothetical protein